MVGFQFGFSGGGRISQIFGGLMFAGVATVFIIVGLVVTASSGWQGYTWQKTDATVLRVEGGGEGDDHVAATYSYAAGAHTSEAYEKTVQADLKDNDYKKMAAWHPGSTVAVWYDPRHPDVSELNLQGSAAMLGFSLFAVPFFLVGIGQLRSGIRGKSDIGLSGRRTPVLFGLCCVGAFACMLPAMALPFHWGLAVFLVYTAVVIPRVLRWSDRLTPRPRKRRAAPPPQSDEVRLPIKKLLGWLGFGVFWCGITGIFVVILVMAMVRSIAATQWPATSGEVLVSKVESSSGSEGTTYSPEIRYRYLVGDRKYVNDRCDFMGGSASDGDYAQRMVAAHPRGSTVTVYYDPANPGSSVLAREVPPLTYMMAVFAQPFVVIGLGIMIQCLMLVLRYRQMRRFLAAPVTMPWHIPLWGVLRPTTGAATIRGRTIGFASLVAAFAMGYGLTTFAAIFILGFGVGMTQVTAPVFLMTMAACVAADLAAMVHVAVRHSHTRFVTLNLLQRTLTVRDRAGELSVNLKDIRGWRIRKVPIGWTIWSKTKTGHGLQLEAVTSEGTTVPLHDFEYSALLEHSHTERIVRHVRQGLAQLTETPGDGPG